MKRMPKFTSRMFKPKMKRFGAAAPKMPSMPRIKKFAEGGAIGYEEAPPAFESSKKKTFKEAYRNARQDGKEFFKWEGKLYDTQTKEERKKMLDEATEKFMANPPYKNMARKLGTFKLEKQKEPEEYMAKGGKVRGDGIAKKGKTRGRYV